VRHHQRGVGSRKDREVSKDEFSKPRVEFGINAIKIGLANIVQHSAISDILKRKKTQ